MPLATLKEVLDPAIAGGYGVGEFSIATLEDVVPILDAVQEQHSPVILDYAEVFVRFTAPRHMAALVHALAADYDIPIVFHYGHASNLDRVKEAIDLGFTSIMFDVSREPFEENLARTKAASEVIHAAGVSLEAELGHVGGRETADQTATQSTMTVPSEAAEFVSETACDSLAICVGNSHGLYKGTPKLDYGLIAELRSTLPCGLALHGGSGLPDGDLREAVRAGITKLSIYTDISIVQVAAVRAAVADANRYLIFPEVVAPAKAQARELVAAKNRLYGSAGRA